MFKVQSITSRKSKKQLHSAKKRSKEKDTSKYRSPSVDEMHKDEQAILNPLQERSFSEEISRDTKRRCK